MNSATLSSASVTLSGRELALKRRKAMALNGKAALTRSQATVATPLAAADNSRASADAKPAVADSPVGDGQAALDKGASGRQVAMHRRMVLAQTGRPATSSTDSSGAGRRTVGRVRPQVNSPSTALEKVEEGHALRGRPVTGIQVERSMKVTGNEHGSCRAVTGTEYIGAEQFDNLCESRPNPASAKVAVSTTLRQQKVTGIEVGRSGNVTGDEWGACRGITGTEYLSAERYDEFCASRPEPGPKKVGQTHTAAGKVVTGTRFGQSENVSGDDAGACRGITGTEYLSQEQFIASCGTQAPVRPLKVSVMSSRPKPIGGDNGGGLPVSKIGVDQAGRGQAVTGSYFGPTLKVTGNEFGVSARVSGSQYAGPRSLDDFSEPSTVVAWPEPVRSTAVISAAAVTGDRPGAGGSAMTGDARGGCKPVSGRFLSRQSSVEAIEPSPAPLAFSIQSPARVAHDQTLSQVTGNSLGIDRITGAANKAGGLITGTPEFRHQVVPQPLAAEVQLASPAGKVTGEGSQAGREVTGDAWHATRRVTGTEGASSLMRNPSAKGTPRGMGVNAQVFRTLEKPVIPVLPESRITGSAGSSGKGASVTLSGGARG